MIDQQIIPGANHFFDGKLEPLMETVTGYLDMRLANVSVTCDEAGSPGDGEGAAQPWGAAG